ncbi:hypothetical protein [Telmatospirillum sp.]|uniref:hypothetical protein n=1 Tax=Telmatospirillum sp. TaxID=2079197 RepID=UPI00283CF192|nr:hypothetical protein [Telmatospirillum sp.]MDR3440444.1 hypothetical protein [Telmatospirillum sp.]
MGIVAVAGGVAQYLLNFANSMSNRTSGGTDGSGAAGTAATGRNGPDQLAALQNRATSVQQQADATVAAGRREDLLSITDDLSGIVSGVKTQISSLAVQSLSNADLKQVKSAISSVLNTVNATVKELTVLVPRGGSTSSALAGTTLNQLANTTADLAEQTGVALRQTSVSVISSGISWRRPNLVDLLV